jgi:hypothetical protein
MTTSEQFAKAHHSSVEKNLKTVPFDFQLCKLHYVQLQWLDLVPHSLKAHEVLDGRIGGKE